MDHRVGVAGPVGAELAREPAEDFVEHTGPVGPLHDLGELALGSAADELRDERMIFRQLLEATLTDQVGA